MSNATLVLAVNAVLGLVGFVWFRASIAVGAIKRLFLPEIPNKSDLDRIFSATKAEWNRRTSAAQYVLGWSTRIEPRAEGDRIHALERKTGRSVSLLAFYRREDGPPESLRINHYFPAGRWTLDDGSTSRMESRAKARLGDSYGATVSRSASPDGKFDVLSVSITKAGPRPDEKRGSDAAPGKNAQE